MTLPTRDLPEPARELIRALAESARRNRRNSWQRASSGKDASFCRGMSAAYLIAGRMVRESFGGRP
jgi:hypothetical protein